MKSISPIYLAFIPVTLVKLVQSQQVFSVTAIALLKSTLSRTALLSSKIRPPTIPTPAGTVYVVVAEVMLLSCQIVLGTVVTPFILAILPGY